jgi:hypothetical protein
LVKPVNSPGFLSNLGDGKGREIVRLLPAAREPGVSGDNPAGEQPGAGRAVWPRRQLASSTAGLAVIAAAALTPAEFDQIVSQNQLYFSPDWHGLAQI